MFLPTAFAALALLFSQTPPSPHPAPGAVVATLDGAPLTAAEVDPYLWEWKSREVIDELLSHRVIAAEAAKKNVTASDAEIKARMDEQLAAIAPSVPQGQTIEEFIKLRAGGRSRLSLVAKTSVLLDKLAALEFKPDGFVKVGTMVFIYDASATSSIAKAIKDADAAYAALQANKPWDAVLRQYEKRPEVLETHGLIGWKAAGVFPESVQTQFKTLKPLGVTKPTQTENGIQIFRLLARGATATPAEIDDLKKEFVKGTRAALAAKLRAAAKVEYK